MTWNFSNTTGDNNNSGLISENGGNVYVYKVPDRGLLSSVKLKASLNTLSSNIINQWELWRSHVKPILNSLPAGASDSRWNLHHSTNALLYGVQGSTLLVNNDATENTSDGRYWDSSYERPKTIAESFEDLWDKVALIESTALSITSGSNETNLAYLGNFIGMTDPESSELPSYSSTTYVTQGNSLETAIGELDSALSSFGSTLQDSYEAGNSIILSNTDGSVSITAPDSSNVVALDITNNDTTNDPNSVSITNTTSGYSLFLTGSGEQKIWSDQQFTIGSSQPATGVAIQSNVTSGIANLGLLSQSSNSSADMYLWSNTTADTATISISASGNSDLSSCYLSLNAQNSGSEAAYISIGSTNTDNVYISGSTSLYLGSTNGVVNQGDLYFTDSRYAGSIGPANAVPFTDESNTDFDFSVDSIMDAVNKLYGFSNEAPAPLVIPTTDQEFIDALESTAPCTIILRAQDYTISSVIYTGATKVVLGTGYAGLTDDGTKSSRIMYSGTGQIRVNDHGFTIKNTRLIIKSDASDIDYMIFIDSPPNEEYRSCLIDNCFLGSEASGGIGIDYIYSASHVVVSNCTFTVSNYSATCIEVSGSYASCDVFDNRFLITSAGSSISGKSGSCVCFYPVGVNFANFHNNYIGYYDAQPSFNSSASLIVPLTDNCTITDNIIDFGANTTLCKVLYHSGNEFEKLIFSNNTIKFRGNKSYGYNGVISGRWEKSIISNNIIETSLGSDVSGIPNDSTAKRIAIFNLGTSHDVAIENNTILPYFSPNSYEPCKTMVYLDQGSDRIKIKNNNFLYLGSGSASLYHYGIYVYRQSNYSNESPMTGLQIIGNTFDVYWGRENRFKLFDTGDYLPNPWEYIIFKDNIVPSQKIDLIDFSKFGERFISDLKRTNEISDNYQIQHCDCRINADASIAPLDLSLYCAQEHLKAGHHITVKKTDNTVNTVSVLSNGVKQLYNETLAGINFDGHIGFQRFHNSIIFQDEFYFGQNGDDTLLKWDETAKSTDTIYSGPGSTSSSWIRSMAKYVEPSGGTDQLLYFIVYQYSGGSFDKYLKVYDGSNVTDLGNGAGLELYNVVVDNSTGMVYCTTDETNDRVYSYDPDTTTWTHLSLGDYGTLESMIVYDGDLYVSNGSSTIIHKWDGSTWTAIDLTAELGVNGPYRTKQLFIGNTKLFVADEDRNIASFDGTTWSLVCDYSSDFILATTSGFDSFCFEAVDDENIYGVGYDPRSEVYNDYYAGKMVILHINTITKKLNIIDQIYLPGVTNFDNNTFKMFDANNFIAMTSSKIIRYERTMINGSYSVALSSQGDYVSLRYDGQDWWGTGSS